MSVLLGFLCGSGAIWLARKIERDRQITLLYERWKIGPHLLAGDIDEPYCLACEQFLTPLTKDGPCQAHRRNRDADS